MTGNANGSFRKKMASLRKRSVVQTEELPNEKVGDYLWSYRVEDGTASIAATPSPKPSGALEIPAMLGGCPVSAIDDAAFHNCADLVSVAIPASVKVIGEGAFGYCGSLESIDLTGNSSYVFEDGLLLAEDRKVLLRAVDRETVAIPAGVERIGGCAFAGCNTLAMVSIPASVTTICAGAFGFCRNLKSFEVSADNQAYVFVDGFLLRKDLKVLFRAIDEEVVSIPPTVKGVADFAFAGCRRMASVMIPEGVREFGKRAFMGCTNLVSVTIPEDVTTIASGMFRGCKNLKTVALPWTLKRLGANVFAGCDALATIMVAPGDGERIRRVLEKGGVDVAHLSFEDPTKRETVGGYSWSYRIVDGKSVIVAKPSPEPIGDLEIPSCLGGSQVTEIGSCAFRDCAEGLKSIVIPGGVTKIGSCAFEDCAGLMSVTIPDGVVTLGRYAFSGCHNVRSVTIPASVTEIGDSVFAYCFSIECFDVSDDNANFVAGSDGLLTKDGKTLVRAFDVEDATIPAGVERIAFGAFSGSSRITSLTIPRSVKEIGNGGFDHFVGCDSLTTIKVAKGDAERVKEMIGDSNFAFEEIE